MKTLKTCLESINHLPENHKSINLKAKHFAQFKNLTKPMMLKVSNNL